MDGEVAALDEFDAHLAGEVGCSKLGGIEDAGGEEGDGGVVAAFGGEGAEGFEEFAGVVVDGTDAAIAQETGVTRFITWREVSM